MGRYAATAATGAAEKHTKEPEAEAVSETAPDPEPPTPNPEPPRTVGEAVNLIYRRRQTETCETVAEALHSVPMRDWERDDFDRLKEALDGSPTGTAIIMTWRIPSFRSRPRRSCLAPQTACSFTRTA